MDLQPKVRDSIRHNEELLVTFLWQNPLIIRLLSIFQSNKTRKALIFPSLFAIFEKRIP